MSNPYFQFKQFIIYQDLCAMKVGTDGVLLGAWTDVSTAQKILDIGTGTGLIALMLAQRSNANIDAIEIDFQSYTQAQVNINNSPWTDRITVHHAAINQFKNLTRTKYCLIVSNPPFFNRSLKTHCPKRNLARHDDQLPQSDLIDAVRTLMKEDGMFVTIYPKVEASKFEDQAYSCGLYCVKKLYIRPTAASEIKRVIMMFRFYADTTIEAELALQNENGLTAEFVELVEAFYINY